MSRKQVRALLFLPMLLSCVGLASCCSPTVYPYSPHSNAVAAGTAGAAELTIVREASMRIPGVWMGQKVYVAGSPIMNLCHGSWGRVYLNPGRYAFRVGWGSEWQEPPNMQQFDSGGTYYFKVDGRGARAPGQTTGPTSVFWFEEISKETAEALIPDLRRAKRQE